MASMALIASVALAFVAACSRSNPGRPRPQATSADGSTVAVTPISSHAAADSSVGGQHVERAPLASHPWIVELVEPGPRHSPTKLGFVTVPLGAREARPVMIALHGSGDRPEWACGEWFGVVNAFPFIVCPRGTGSESALGWSHLADTRARIAKALTAARAIFDEWMAQGPMVLAGFSRGAIQAALIAQEDPKTYPRVVLSESSFDPDSAIKFQQPWVNGGGQRLLLSCTTLGCEGPFRNAARNAAKLGASARVNIAGTSQHGIWDTVIQSISRDWPWLVQGAEGWNAYTPRATETPLPGRTIAFDSPP